MVSFILMRYAGKLADKREAKTMRMRTKLPIVTLVGAGALLLTTLAAIFTLRSQTAYAQDTPYASISMGEDTLPQGGSTYLVAVLTNMPRDPNDNDKVALTYQFDLERHNGGEWIADESWDDVNSCGPSGLGVEHSLDKYYLSRLNIEPYGRAGFTIDSSCLTGSYRVKFEIKTQESPPKLLDSDIRYFTVRAGPSVTIDLPSTSVSRGTAISATLKFHDLPFGETFKYKANVMSRHPPNFAEICEGSGLGRHDEFALGSVDENPEERAGTVAATCPTNEYRLHVNLYNSESRKVASDTEDFVITTASDAKPSATMQLSSSSVQPGTVIDATATFYDLQGDSNTRLYFKAYVTKEGNDEKEDSCHGQGCQQTPKPACIEIR